MAEHKSSSLPYIAIVALVAVVAVVVLVLNSSSSETTLVVDEEGNVIGEAAGSRWRTSTESQQARLQAREDQRAQERKDNYCTMRAVRDSASDRCYSDIARVCAASDDACNSKEQVKCAGKDADRGNCCIDSTTQQQQELCFK